MELDPKNRLLGRGPRFRVEAEVVRDIALAASGLLSNKLGGPSVIPPVPQNVLNYNYVVPSYWTAATGDDRYRRAVYVFRKRSMPDPGHGKFRFTQWRFRLCATSSIQHSTWLPWPA